MFEHLDDANPSDGRERYADVVGAAARRRKKIWYAAGSSTAVVTAAVVVLTIVLLQPTGNATSRLVTAPTPSAEPTPSAQPTSSPTPTHTPSPRPSPTHKLVAPTPHHSAPPTPSPTCTYQGVAAANCPDGRPGWSGGFAGCSQATPYGRSTSPSPDLAVALTVPSAMRGGHDANGTATLTNNGNTTITLQVAPRAELLNSAHKPVSGVNWSDAVTGQPPTTLQPGASASLTVLLHAAGCADTGEQPEPALAPGDYFAKADLPWSTSDGRQGEIVTSEQPITIT